MDTALIFSALALGFATGFHCIGMCGPIALSMGLTRKQAARFHLQNTTYNLGRIVTYAALGAILGSVGKGFEMAGFQRYLTIFSGILLILLAVFTYAGNDYVLKIPFLSRFFLGVKNRLGKILRASDLKSRFATGILNGLLPCGMVYMALTASLAAGGIWQGALFMTLFGFGTFPFMFLVVLAGNLITGTVRAAVLRIVPGLMLILGALFIVRGLELGIPYLSPPKESLKVIHNNSEKHHMGDHSSCH